MKKSVIVCLSTVMSVAGGLAIASSASAATPSWLHVRTVTRATAYNNSTVRVTPSVTVSGQRVITKKTITVYRNGKRYRSGASVQVPAGRYLSVTSGSYKSYTLSKERRIRRVLHGGDLVQATCTVTQVTDLGLGDGTTDSIATCRNSYYPSQAKPDEEFASYQVGDSYQELEFFDDEYVSQAYYVQVRHYGAAHAFTSPKRTLTVKDGGFRRLYTGSGIQTEASFRAPASTWKISYSWNCSNFGYSGNMIISVYRSNGDFFDVAANRLAYSGSGHSFVHGTGHFYLEMNSECDWQVVVTR